MKRGVLLIIGAVFLIIVIVVAVAAVRSKPKAPETVTLKIWSPFEEADIYKTISQSFLEQYPNTKIEFRYIDAANSQEYEAKVVDAIASGEGPDVWLIRADWLPKHQPKLVSSTGLAKWSTKKKVTEQEALAAMFSKAVVDENSREGQLYGLPVAVDSLALYVNKKVINQVRRELDDARDKRSSTFDTYPTTWAEVEQWSRLITKTDKGNPTRSGLALGLPENTYAATDVFTAILQQKGGSLFTAAEDQVSLHLALTKAGQSSLPGQEALSLYSSFGTPGNENFTWNTSVGNPAQALIAGRAAMVLAYSSFGDDLRRIDKNAADYVVIRPLPQLDPLKIKTDRTDFAMYWTHVVPKNSPHTQQAWQFIRNITSNANVRVYGKATKKPVVSSVVSATTVSASSNSIGDTELFSAQVHFSAPVYKPEWQLADEAVQVMMIRVIQQAQSVQVAIDSAAEQLKKSLNQ